MNSPSPLFPIVGIGASAGGIEALQGFFYGFAPDCGLGFVIITHLSPDRESMLHEVMERYTDMPVRVAEEGAVVEPGCIYVMPSNAILTIKAGRLSIRHPDRSRRERNPIDIFLASLAQDQGDCAIGVVLSGGGSDGTLGIKAIKERGGLTLAQVADGSAPAHPEMPGSAIATGLVDLAIPVDEMHRKLLDFVRLQWSGRATQEGEQDQGEARRTIYAMLRNRVGHDFSGYKSNTFMRRVQRRMHVLQLEQVDAYIERLNQDPDEIGHLFRDLLINVTNFFRDADAFEALQVSVIPALFEQRGAEDTVRVWVPGCATGEEVFSIAILMREQMDRLQVVPRVQIFATDIDDAALAVARAGRYPEALLDSVSAERRSRFFVNDGSSYVVSREIRDLCIFSPHSVLRDPPFSRIDLISCRNLLIYFGPDAQAQVIPTFHYSLKPGGYLFLGTSESISQFSELFVPLEKKLRIFRARDGATAARLPTVVADKAIASAPFVKHRGDFKSQAGSLSMRHTIETHVLDRYAPPHVVVNRDGDVLFYSAKTGKYLEAPAGAPTRQILTIARKGLRLDLRGALREALETQQTIRREHVAVDGDGDSVQLITLLVDPVEDRNLGETLYLVVFQDEGRPVSRNSVGLDASPELDGTIVHLEREMRDTRERLQSTIEEYETALEELKSSNEELVSVNEEMQSTNEELEASKEELQSLNEELQTVNIELSSKLDDLDRANSDLKNLFDSTQIATVFLDRDLVIRSFTPAVSRIFRLIPGDRGRPLTDLAINLPYPELQAHVLHVFRSGEMVEHRIDQKATESHYLVRLIPYRDTEEKITGVVITFVDVTTLSQSEEHQRVLIAELNHRVKTQLTVAVAIAQQTRKFSTSPEASYEALIGRLRAMARAYELVSGQGWSAVALDEILQKELLPFGLDSVTLEGPAVMLPPKQALSLGMVFHELANNAATYGALSQPGHVAIVWSTSGQDARRVSIEWSEIGGPEPAPPAGQGFGLTLVTRELEALAGAAAFDFRPAGLVARLSLML